MKQCPFNVKIERSIHYIKSLDGSVIGQYVGETTKTITFYPFYIRAFNIQIFYNSIYYNGLVLSVEEFFNLMPDEVKYTLIFNMDILK